MKLSAILETGHWAVLGGDYPGRWGKKPSRQERPSMLLHPSDRERFINWGYSKKSKSSKAR